MEKKESSGIIIPDGLKKEEKKGRVVKITKLRNPEYLPGLGKGSEVLFGRYQKTVYIGDIEYLLMDEQDILYYNPV